MDVLGRMEHPASGRDVKAASGVDARSRTAVAAATTKMARVVTLNCFERVESSNSVRSKETLDTVFRFDLSFSLARIDAVKLAEEGQK